MGIIVSSAIRVTEDISGNKQTEAQLLIEFTDASYIAGGEIFDLSPYVSRVERIVTNLASGANLWMPVPSNTDIPGGPISTRIALYMTMVSTGLVSGAGPGQMVEVASGAAVSGNRAVALVYGY